jgi:hypothetical protein
MESQPAPPFGKCPKCDEPRKTLRAETHLILPRKEATVRRARQPDCIPNAGNAVNYLIHPVEPFIVNPVNHIKSVADAIYLSIRRKNILIVENAGE